MFLVQKGKFYGVRLRGETTASITIINYVVIMNITLLIVTLDRSKDLFYVLIDVLYISSFIAPSQSSDTQRNSDSSDHFPSGRITPPATNLPRFKKYAVTDFNFLKVSLTVILRTVVNDC